MGVAELLSTSIFITFNLPRYCVATSSTTGPSALQGPHHAAQKSTRTGSVDCKTSFSNVASITSSTALPAIHFLLGDCQNHFAVFAQRDSVHISSLLCGDTPTEYRMLDRPLWSQVEIRFVRQKNSPHIDLCERLE